MAGLAGLGAGLGSLGLSAAAQAQAPAPTPIAPGAVTPPAPRHGAPVFVLNSLDGNVSVIDSQRWVEIKRIPTGKEPHHLYLTPDERSVIVANAGSDSLTFIDPRSAEVQRVVRGILDPYHLRFSPDMKWFVTAANRLNHIDIYRWDGSNPTLAKRIATGRTPSHLWIDPHSTTVWARIFRLSAPAVSRWTRITSASTRRISACSISPSCAGGLSRVTTCAAASRRRSSIARWPNRCTAAMRLAS